MPHPPGTRPGPQPPSFAKAVPNLKARPIPAGTTPTKMHPCKAYGKRDKDRVRRTLTTPPQHFSRMWEPTRSQTIDQLKAAHPRYEQDLLRRLCCDAEIACRTIPENDLPVWHYEVVNLWNPHHPVLGTRVRPIFLTRFLQCSLQLPMLLVKSKLPFTAPPIPWEFSRDAFLPKETQPDHNLIDQYDLAWASIRAITYHRQVVLQNRDPTQRPREGDEEFVERYLSFKHNIGYTYEPSLLAQAYAEACKPAGFYFDLVLLRPFHDSYKLFVRPFMPLCVLKGAERQLRSVNDEFSTANANNAIAFSGREWGAPLTDEIIDLRRNYQKSRLLTSQDYRGSSQGDAISLEEGAGPPCRYADVEDTKEWYYDGKQTFLEALPGDGNYEKPQTPYAYGLNRSPASCTEAQISWRATFHSWNRTVIKPRKNRTEGYWATQHKGVSYRDDQVTRATQYDLSLAMTLAGPRSRPNADYEQAVHRAIFCDKDETHVTSSQTSSRRLTNGVTPPYGEVHLAII